jgi:hypothetical protein
MRPLALMLAAVVTLGAPLAARAQTPSPPSQTPSSSSQTPSQSQTPSPPQTSPPPRAPAAGTPTVPPPEPSTLPPTPDSPPPTTELTQAPPLPEPPLRPKKRPKKWLGPVVIALEVGALGFAIASVAVVSTGGMDDTYRYPLAGGLGAGVIACAGAGLIIELVAR